MFIYSVKGQKLSIVASIIVSILIIIGTVTFLPNENDDFSYPDDVLPAVKDMKPSDFKNIKTNDERVSFLKQYGWEVNPEAKEVTEVIVPKEFDSIYEKYNELQIGEGLNLEKYKGKSVKRYTYLVENYQYDGTVYANLLIYKNCVIGGDICSAKKDGFVHGLTKGNDFLT